MAKARRQKRIEPGFAIKLITMLAVIAAVVLCAMIFFKINVITVSGSEHYSDEEIIAAANVSEGDNLTMLNKSQTASAIMSKLPYVDAVQIRRQLPDTLVLEIEESIPMAAVQTAEGRYWLMDAQCKLLEQADGPEDHMLLVGIEPKAPHAGAQLVTDNTEAYAVLEQILSGLERYGLREGLTTLDLTELYDIEIWMGEQYEIKLGDNQELDYKIQYLQAVLENLDSNQGGIIDLTLETEKVARFLPW